MTTLRNRLPYWKDIFYVFGGVVFVIYSWSIRGFLYQLSSLLLYHTLGEILAIFSYLMAFALLETLVIISSLILVGIILPRKWFTEGFAYKGFITMLIAGTAMIALQSYLFSSKYAAPSMGVVFLVLGLALTLLIMFIGIFQKRLVLQKFLLAVQERLQIFIYFYVPLGLVGLVVVVYRNLGG